ncbi:MAG: hypothetical protein FJY74_03610 [Candidatus Eisenbacteria bacterium]|nr:hypothetical protein [Candidatus Eisenbacteria bacterium]
MRRPLAISIMLAAAAAFGGGCANPANSDDQADLPPLRTSPAKVLERLQWAYDNMDVEVYLDCLAADFIFLLNPRDVENDPDLEPGYWGNAEERVIHEQMFGAEGDHADNILLTLTQVGDPLPVDPGDGTGTHYQYKEAVDLRVYMGAWTYLATAPSLFRLRIDQDETGPQGEQLWEIWRWQDLEGARSGRGAESSWGSIKALFR